MYKQVAWRCGEDKLPGTQESGPWHRGLRHREHLQGAAGTGHTTDRQRGARAFDIDKVEPSMVEEVLVLPHMVIMREERTLKSLLDGLEKVTQSRRTYNRTPCHQVTYALLFN